MYGSPQIHEAGRLWESRLRSHAGELAVPQGVRDRVRMKDEPGRNEERREAASMWVIWCGLNRRSDISPMRT